MIDDDSRAGAARLIRNPRVWAWAAVVGAAVVCAVLFWMSRVHRQVIDETTAALTSLREARVDLAKGLLYVTLGSEPSGPFDRDQGFALLAQATDGLEAVSRPTADLAEYEQADDLEVFRESLHTFRAMLSQSIAVNGPAGDAALRGAFYMLERQADHLDAHILAQLAGHSVRTDRTFLIVLVTSFVLLGIVCMGIVVSSREQQRATRALQESERALREHARGFSALTAASPTAIHSYHVALDGSASFRFASGRIEDIYGLTPADLARDPEAARLRVHPEDADRLRQKTEASRRSLSPWHEEFRVNHPTKGEVWVEGHSMPVRESDGSTTWHGTLTDITRRKQGEIAVRERLAMEERLSRLAATSPGVMCEFQRRPDGTYAFPFASERVRDVLGVEPGEIVADAAPALTRIHAEDRLRIRAGINQSARKQTEWTDLFRYEHPTKGLAWLEGRATPARDADGSVRWHGFLLDVTGRRQLEDQYRQSQKMEAIGLLAGGIAHDFNNLLTVIQGHASMLRLPEVAVDPIEAAREIESAADRAAALTEQLLLFGRKQVMRPVDLDLNDVVANVARLLQRVIGEDVALDAVFAPQLPLVHADPGMVEQVLLNLAVNARDAMPAGGRLEIRTGSGLADERTMRQFPDAVPGPFVSLQARDTGAGMSREILSRIFEPFFTTKEAGRGTGLGLATVYGIVRQHHGWIGVDSEPGCGTTFSIYLPATTRRVARPVVTTVVADRPAGTETVLVVEDEPAVRELTARVLERRGYKVLTASSGVAALDVWRSHAPEISLVLTDMVMPEGVNGSELARRLREMRPDVKVLFTSGYAAEALGDERMLDSSVHFLPKPFQPDDLARAVRRCLDEVAPASPAPGPVAPA